MSAPQLPERSLRVGLLFRGEVRRELLAVPGRPVTLGESGRADLVVPGQPRRRVLFEPRGQGFALVAHPGMKGRIALETGVFELSGAPGEARDGATVLRLDERSRGRLELGEWTVLFQFVATPLQAARPAADFRPPLLGETDQTFVGFLSTFSAAAVALLSVAANTPIPEGFDVAEAPERVIERILLNTTPLPTPAVEVRAAPEDSLRARARAVVENRAARRATRDDPPEQPAEDRRTVAERLAASPLLAGIIGTHGSTGRADMFTGADIVGDQVRASMGGVTSGDQAAVGSMSLHVGSGGRDDAGVGELGRSGPGGKTEVRGPSSGRTPAARADQGWTLPPSAGGDAEAGIRGKVKTYSAAVQSCYEATLRLQPETSGRVVLSLSLAAGRVSDAVVVQNTTGSQDLALCVEQRALGWRFDPSVTLDFTVPFALSPG